MSGSWLNYDRAALDQHLAGYGLTTREQLDRVHASIRRNTQETDLWVGIRGGITQAGFFLQALVQMLTGGGQVNFSTLMERARESFSTSERRNPQRNVNEAMHAIRDEMEQMGGAWAAAAQDLTGDTLHGNQPPAWNLRRVANAGLAQQPTPEDIARGTRLDRHAQGVQAIYQPTPDQQRFAVTDTPDVSAAVSPNGINRTHTLT